MQAGRRSRRKRMSLWLRSILLILDVLVNGSRKARTPDGKHPPTSPTTTAAETTTTLATTIVTTPWWANLDCRDSEKAAKNGTQESFFDSLWSFLKHCSHENQTTSVNVSLDSLRLILKRRLLMEKNTQQIITRLTQQFAVVLAQQL